MDMFPSFIIKKQKQQVQQQQKTPFLCVLQFLCTKHKKGSNIRGKYSKFKVSPF